MGGQRLYFGQISCSVGMSSHGIFSISNSIIAAQLVHRNYGAGLYSFISFRTTLREERSAEPICYIVVNGFSWAKDGRFSPDGAFPLGREWGVSFDAVTFAKF